MQMRKYGKKCCDLQGREVYFSTLEDKQMHAGLDSTKEDSLALGTVHSS